MLFFDEWLPAIDYILAEGNDQLFLCDRGIRNFETNTHFSLDLLSVPVVKKISHLTIAVDPSSASGQRDLVIPMSRAAIAAGADGIFVELNIDPAKAIVDGYQTPDTEQFKRLTQH
jgi:3-deoxy-7-phosphoheptulonate synthase